MKTIETFSVQSTFISNSNPNQNFNLNPFIFVRKDSQFTSLTVMAQALFFLSPQVFHRLHEIKKAELFLHIETPPDDYMTLILVNHSTKASASNVTWNSSPTPQVTYDEIEISPHDKHYYVCLELTDLFHDFISGTIPFLNTSLLSLTDDATVCFSSNKTAYPPFLRLYYE